MTRGECDSTTISEVSFQDGSYQAHANGCTGIGAPCTRSLLQLALIAGSAYAIRFATCIVNVNTSRKSTLRTRYSPYQSKIKRGATTRAVSRKTENTGNEKVCVNVVSSSTDLSSLEPTADRKVCVHSETGLTESLQIKKPKPLEKTQSLLKPLRIIAEAEDSSCNENKSGSKNSPGSKLKDFSQSVDHPLP